ncbi:hypothetical protein BH10BAC5_BH10BAC5_25100 [soil metagenome]
MRKYFNLFKFKKLRKNLRNLPTQPEQTLWLYLKNNSLSNLKFRRQQGIGNYIVDFYCPSKKLVIELDGDSHTEKEAIEYDKIRTEFFCSKGIKVIRFANEEVTKNIKRVLEEIEQNT